MPFYPKTKQKGGLTTTAEVSRHWRVDPDTARAILTMRGAVPLRVRGVYWWWHDVWHAEGLRLPVPKDDEEAYKAPLLDKNDLASRYGRPARTVRKWMAQGTMPAIRLGPRILRARKLDLDRADQALLDASRLEREDPGEGICRLITRPTPNGATAPMPRVGTRSHKAFESL